ncbi:MAG: aldose 1-epimerase family protein [Acidobacteriota bacterium]|nr:aldose 1-epimerase family protein [Acidobacteriota bacterium]
MANLYGEKLTRLALAQRTGSLSQFGGVRLMECSDGLERGIRLLEFRTGTGLRFTVLADRAFDIGDCEYRGAAIGWHSPAGFRHPAFHEYEGEDGLAWLRSFSGLLVTCGLDHILGAESENAEHYFYPNRKTIKHSIHGRISTIPGKLLAYGEQWHDDECVLFCEGLVQQSAVFAEDLHLLRRIESRVGSNEILIRDRVTNHGFCRTPHMLLYHINVGYPVLSEGSRYLAPVKHAVWASHEQSYRAQNAGYNTFPAPRSGFVEQVWEHSLAADGEGKIPVAVVNDSFDNGKGLGLLLEVNKKEFPCHIEWQNFQEGQYTVGIEPATNHVLGKSFAKERNELIWLEHGETREYTTRLSVLEGQSIRTAEDRIRQIIEQPRDQYPPLSGEWERLR